MDSANRALSATQRRVLVAVKRQGESTVDELGELLEISPSAVRQHLGALESAGMVSSRRQYGLPGRPANRYRATARAESLFEADDGRFSLELLGHLEAEAPELVARVFDRRRVKMVDDARSRVEGMTTDERVGIVAELLDDQGCLADSEVVDDGHHRINLHTCPVWAVASRHREACTSELDFICDLIPGATVERVTHKTSGDHTCVYEIRATS
ncbi:MAG: ArsR family transcriptional regulator [Acidimicrobiales bacterium]